MPGRRGLVLGGGGITGIAWETGLLHGLAEAGVDVTDADLVVGTSAGSVVGAQVRSGTSLADLYTVQTTPPATGGPAARIGGGVVAHYAGAMLLARGRGEAFRRRLGRYAVRRAAAGRTPTLQERLDAIAERLPSTTWPARPLHVVAVDAESGAVRVLDGSDETSLLEAVAASCAVPGVYPPVPLQGRPHVDGGVRSYTNADLAADCDRVLVLAPVDRRLGPMLDVARQLRGVDHVLVTPDAGARAAIGRNVLDPAAKVASAEAGRAQARDVVEDVRRLWAS